LQGNIPNSSSESESDRVPGGPSASSGSSSDDDQDGGPTGEDGGPVGEDGRPAGGAKSKRRRDGGLEVGDYDYMDDFIDDEEFIEIIERTDRRKAKFQGFFMAKVGALLVLV
jgi:hypothetical protein